MSDIVCIDDVITESSPDGKKIKSIVEAKGYSINFINTKVDIDNLIKFPPDSLKLILLDLDLSKIKIDAEKILTSLAKKGGKVIMLSALPKTSQMRKKGGYSKYQQDLPSMNMLYNKGALTYIYKSELGERDDFVANTIDHTIGDPANSQYTLILNPELACFKIVDNKNNMVMEKKLPVNANWSSQLELSTTPWDVIMRILFEMGKASVKEIRISNVYGKDLKDLRALMPQDFQKILGVFNDDIRSKSDGLIVGRLLQGGGHGDRSGIYKANIGHVRLKNHESKPVDIDWKASVEKRLSFLEDKLKKLQKNSPSK